MEIVFGVSLTPTAVRMVLVEGPQADGAIVDHDVFDLDSRDAAGTAEQVISAVLGTRESAFESGHHLTATGVTWSDYQQAAALRQGLASRGIDDVLLFPQLHSASALAKASGRAVGYQTVAFMLVEQSTVTLAVVRSDDGTVVKANTRSLHDTDAMAVLSDMVSGLDTAVERPEALLIVGSGVDLVAVRAHLEDHVAVPVVAPAEPELALARGAALAAVNEPSMEASTVGLAYSREPDEGTTAGAVYQVPSSGDVARHTTASANDAGNVGRSIGDLQDGRKPFLLAGSSLIATFVVGIVALGVSVAVAIHPSADQHAGSSAPVIRPPVVATASPPAQTGPTPPPAMTPPPAVAPPPPPAPPAAVLDGAPQPLPAPASPPTGAAVEAPAPTAHPVAAPSPVAAAPVQPPPPVLLAPIIDWLPTLLQPRQYQPRPPSYPIAQNPYPYSPPTVSPPWYPTPWQQPLWPQHRRGYRDGGGD